jgi:hypothetical protein
MAYLSSLEFPRSVGFHRLGGAAYNTTVVTTSSGQESRNANWSVPRARYTVSVITPATNAGVPVAPAAFVATLLSFFQQAQGKLNSFNYFDPLINADVPVRFDTDTFDVQVEESNVSGGQAIISWNSLVLVGVLPPNY